MLKKIKLVLLFLVLYHSPILPQEADIVPYLKQIESGNKLEAEKNLLLLEKKSPGDASVKFLKAVLTENGQDAVELYTSIVKSNPKSKYADASLYRLYAYYYALGLYETAGVYGSRLKKEYPKSDYIKLISQQLPEEDDPINEAPPGEPVIENTLAENDFVYTIQAGAFGNFANAEALKKDFEDSGYPVLMKEKLVGGSSFHIIYVGKFKTEQEAQNFLLTINSEFKLQGRVINLNKI